MSDAHDGGTIELKVVADAKGFRKDLQTKLKAATQGLTQAVKVVADTSDFRKDLETKLRAAAQGLEVAVNVVVDETGLRERIEAAVKEAAAGVAATIDVHVDRQQVKEALDQAVAGIGDDIKVNIGVVGSLVDDVARETAAAQAAADENPVDVPVEPDRKGWGKTWGKWLTKARARIKRDPKSRIGVPVEPTLNMKSFNRRLRLRPLMLASLASLLQPLIALLASVGVGLVALAGSAGSAIGVLGALPGLIGALGWGLVVGITAVGGFVNALGELAAAGVYANGVTELTAEQAAVLRDVLDGLPAPMAAAVVESAKLTSQFQDLKDSIQGNFFAPVAGGIEQLGDLLLPQLNDSLGVTAFAMGVVTRAFLDYFASKKFVDELPLAFTVFADLLERSGFALLDLTKASVDFTASSVPLLGRVGEWITALGVWAERTARVGRETGTTTAFLAYAADKAEQLGRITASTFRGMGGVFRATRAAGDDMLSRIEAGLDRFDEWANSAGGQKAITDFTDEAMPAFYALSSLIGEIGLAMGRLAVSPELAAMLDKLRIETLPPLEVLFANLGQFLGPPVVALISELAEFFGHLSGAAEPIGKLVGFLAGALGLVNNFLSSHGQIATAIGTVAGSIWVLSTVLAVLSKVGFGRIAKGLGAVARAGAGLFAGGAAAGGAAGGGVKEKISEKLGLRGQEVFWRTAMPVYITNKGGGTTGGSSSRGKAFDALVEGNGDDLKRGSRGGRRSGFGGGISIGRGSGADAILGSKGKSRLSKMLAPLQDVAKAVAGTAGGGYGKGAVAGGVGLAGLGFGRSASGGGLGRDIGETVARSSGLKKAFSSGGAFSGVGKFVGGAAKMLGKGGILGTAAGFAGDFIGRKVKDGRGGARDIGGGALAGAASGAGTGALIGSFLGPVGTGIGAAVGGVVGGVVGALKSGGTAKLKKAFADLGINSVGDFAKAIGSGLITVVGVIGGLPQQVTAAAVKLGGSLVAPGRNLMSNLVGALRSKVGSVTGFVREIPGKVITAAAKLPGALTSKGRELMTNLRAGISGNFGIVTRFIGAAIPSGIKTVAKFGAVLLNSGKTLVNGLRDGIKERASIVYDRVRALGGKILSVAEKFKSLKDAGARLAQSLADGLISKLAAAKDAARSIANAVKDFFPGSPVKTGPLRSWNGGGAGKLLGGFLASGLTASEPGVRAAALGLASAVNSTDMGPTALVPRPRAGAGDLRSATGRAGTVFTEGAIQVRNPAPEPASTSIAARLRAISAFGLFE